MYYDLRIVSTSREVAHALKPFLGLTDILKSISKVPLLSNDVDNILVSISCQLEFFKIFLVEMMGVEPT